MARAAEKELVGDVVKIDPDELRNAAVAGKKNIIFDTTLSNGPWTSDLIKDLQTKGYDVEVHAMAAHKLESDHGVISDAGSAAMLFLAISASPATINACSESTNILPSLC